MGFRAEQVATFAKSLVTLAGVSQAWMLTASDGEAATLWMAVRGLDEYARERRLAVRREIERFIEEHETDMQDSGFVLDYYVVVDEPGLGGPQIPSGAEPIAA